MPPTAAHLLVCVGPRCAERGSRDLHARLWDVLEAESLAYYKAGGSVRTTATDCLGACESGPTIACYARRSDGPGFDESFHGGMDLSGALQLARSVAP